MASDLHEELLETRPRYVAIHEPSKPDDFDDFVRHQRKFMG